MDDQDQHINQPIDDRMRGWREQAAMKRQTTVDRLKNAIAQLDRDGRPITVRTIYEVSGMEYNSYGRNPEALALFQSRSAAVAARNKRATIPANREKSQKLSRSTNDSNKDRASLQRAVQQLQAEVSRLQQEIGRLQDVEQAYKRLLHEQVDYEVKIAQLQVELVKYRGYTHVIRGHSDEEDDHTRN